ncbi:MAG: fibronectin type III domain-containing protein [Eubacterium sp.]
MKKILSVALSFIMLISTLAIGSFNVLAQDLSAVPEYKLGDTFTAEYNSVTNNDYIYYAKFIPETSAYYEFTLDTNVGKISGTVETSIVDDKGQDVMYNFADEEFPEAPTVAAKLTAKKTYYFVMYAERCGTYKTNVTINKHSHKYGTYATPAVYYKDYDYIEDGGKLQYCEYCDYYKIVEMYYAPKTMSLSTTSYTYNGKAKKPSVTIKDKKGKVIPASNYTVKYSNNTKVGKATVKVTFKGSKYEGEMKKTFKINPKSTSISKLTAKKKGFTVKWKKQATQTTGYQIQYSTDKNFKKNNKTVTISKNKTTSKTISKLKSKKKYYVRIRTYKTVSGTKYYSSWSKAKSITTKK